MPTRLQSEALWFRGSSLDSIDLLNFLVSKLPDHHSCVAFRSRVRGDRLASIIYSRYLGHFLNTFCKFWRLFKTDSQLKRKIHNFRLGWILAFNSEWHSSRFENLQPQESAFTATLNWFNLDSPQLTLDLLRGHELVTHHSDWYLIVQTLNGRLCILSCKFNWCPPFFVLVVPIRNSSLQWTNPDST